MNCNHTTGQCPSVAQHISQHLDPNGELSPSDDAASIVAQLDDVFASDGGSGVTVEEMAGYLASLPVRA